MIHKNDFHFPRESFPDKLYIRELETELAVAENTIHEAKEAFHYLRQ